jgi:hypothetical protein
LSNVTHHIKDKDTRKLLEQAEREGFSLSFSGGSHIKIRCTYCLRAVGSTGTTTRDVRAIRNLRALLRRHAERDCPQIQKHQTQPIPPAPEEQYVTPPKLTEMADDQLNDLIAALTGELRNRNLRKLNEHVSQLETLVADTIAESEELKISTKMLWEMSDKISLFKKEAKL